MNIPGNMQTPLTARGKPCKLCLTTAKEDGASGGLCHLHGGRRERDFKTPRSESKYWRDLYEKEKAAYIAEWRAGLKEKGRWHTPLAKDISYMSFREWLKEKEGVASPKKSSPKSPKRTPKQVTVESSFEDAFGTFSPKQLPKKFQYFERLPLPAMQEVLLLLNRKELRFICNEYPQAAKVCSTKRFRELYDARYPPSFEDEFERVDPLLGGALFYHLGGEKFLRELNAEKWHGQEQFKKFLKQNEKTKEGFLYQNAKKHSYMYVNYHNSDNIYGKRDIVSIIYKDPGGDF